MKKVIIIDDEPLARDVIKEYLKSYPDIELAAECGDGFEGLKAIQQHAPELIFLDVQMPKINGFEMLELIENPPATIFTTAFDEFAIHAFERNATDYLLKPFSKERFDRAIEKSQQTEKPDVKKLVEEAAGSPQQQDRIVIKDGNKIKIIPISKIHYLEAADDYVKIITDEGTFLKNKTMAYYEQTLSAFQFTRVHRSFIVNTRLITRIEPHDKDSQLILLTTGKQLPMSKLGYTKLKSVLGI